MSEVLRLQQLLAQAAEFQAYILVLERERLGQTATIQRLNARIAALTDAMTDAQVCPCHGCEMLRQANAALDAARASTG